MKIDTLSWYIDTHANNIFTLKATQPATIALVILSSAHIKFKLTLITNYSLVLKYIKDINVMRHMKISYACFFYAPVNSREKQGPFIAVFFMR